MVNIYVNFAYHENLVNMLGGHGIGINIHGCQPNPRNGHVWTKISSLMISEIVPFFSFFSLKEKEQQHQMLDMLLVQLPDAWLGFLFSKIKWSKIGNLFSSGLPLEFLASYPLFSWFGILQDQCPHGSKMNVGMMIA